MTRECGNKRDGSRMTPRIFSVADWTREVMQLWPEMGNKFAYRAAAAGYTPTAICSPPSRTSVPSPEISRLKKSDINTSQLPLHLRVDIRPSFGWDLRKCLLKVLENPFLLTKRRKAEALLLSPEYHYIRMQRPDLGQTFCKNEAKSWSTKTREERFWHNWDMRTNLRAARLWSFL